MQIAGDRTVALLGERRRNPSRTIYVGWIRRSSFLEMFRCGLSLVHLSQMNALNMWNAATRDAIQGDAQDSRDFMVAEINVRAPAAAVPGHHIDVHFDIDHDAWMLHFHVHVHVHATVCNMYIAS